VRHSAIKTRAYQAHSQEHEYYPAGSRKPVLGPFLSMDVIQLRVFVIGTFQSHIPEREKYSRPNTRKSIDQGLVTHDPTRAAVWVFSKICRRGRLDLHSTRFQTVQSNFHRNGKQANHHPRMLSLRFHGRKSKTKLVSHCHSSILKTATCGPRSHVHRPSPSLTTKTVPPAPSPHSHLCAPPRPRHPSHHTTPPSPPRQPHSMSSPSHNKSSLPL
jgi:hypothetical protein